MVQKIKQQFSKMPKHGILIVITTSLMLFFCTIFWLIIFINIHNNILLIRISLLIGVCGLIVGIMGCAFAIYQAIISKDWFYVLLYMIAILCLSYILLHSITIISEILTLLQKDSLQII